jgi:hypothetical protein
MLARGVALQGQHREGFGTRVCDYSRVWQPDDKRSIRIRALRRPRSAWGLRLSQFDGHLPYHVVALRRLCWKLSRQ